MQDRILTALPAQSAVQKKFILLFRRVWAWIFLAGLVVFFAGSVSIQSHGNVNFLTIRNSQNILMAIVPVLLMGLGQAFVVIAANRPFGGMDQGANVSGIGAGYCGPYR